MLEEIFKHGIFGTCPARVWTIEYQKRGLPHLHLLVFLEDSDHFLEPEVIDEMVCAELPDASWDPDGELTDIVKSAMIHLAYHLDTAQLSHLIQSFGTVDGTDTSTSEKLHTVWFKRWAHNTKTHAPLTIACKVQVQDDIKFCGDRLSEPM